MELFFDSSDRFFVFEDFHLAKPTDWYKLMNVGGDDLTQKESKILHSASKIGLRDYEKWRKTALGIWFGCNQLASTKSPKPISISQAWHFCKTSEELHKLPPSQKKLWHVILAPAMPAIPWQKHGAEKNIGEQLCLKHSTAMHRASHARCWKGWLV